MSTEPKLSFKQQQLIVRENAIVDATHQLLAQKGFDLMTMDEVAAEVGIAKASLYKHFPSKDELLRSVAALPADIADIDLSDHLLAHRLHRRGPVRQVCRANQAGRSGRPDRRRRPCAAPAGSPDRRWSPMIP